MVNLKLTENRHVFSHGSLPLNTSVTPPRRVFPTGGGLNSWSSTSRLGSVSGLPVTGQFASVPSLTEQTFIAKAVCLPAGTAGTYCYVVNSATGDLAPISIPEGVIFPIDLVSPLLDATGAELTGAALGITYWISPYSAI
jgi:hypothetical protein